MLNWVLFDRVVEAFILGSASGVGFLAGIYFGWSIGYWLSRDQ